MRITILTHLEKERNESSYDVVVDQVADALRGLGHEIEILGVRGNVEKLVNGLSQNKPELVFNLMETFGKTELGQVALVGLLDLLGVPYTGGGPGEIYLQE